MSNGRSIVTIAVLKVAIICVTSEIENVIENSNKRVEISWVVRGSHLLILSYVNIIKIEILCFSKDKTTANLNA